MAVEDFRKAIADPFRRARPPTPEWTGVPFDEMIRQSTTRRLNKTSQQPQTVSGDLRHVSGNLSQATDISSQATDRDSLPRPFTSPWDNRSASMPWEPPQHSRTGIVNYIIMTQVGRVCPFAPSSLRLATGSITPQGAWKVAEHPDASLYCSHGHHAANPHVSRCDAALPREGYCWVR